MADSFSSVPLPRGAGASVFPGNRGAYITRVTLMEPSDQIPSTMCNVSTEVPGVNSAKSFIHISLPQSKIPRESYLFDTIARSQPTLDVVVTR